MEPGVSSRQESQSSGAMALHRMTINQEDRLLSKLSKASLGMAFPSCLIGVLGLAAYLKTSHIFLIIPPFVSLVAFGGSVATYLSAKYARTNLTRQRAMIGSWKGLVAQDTLMYSLYFLHVAASFYFFLGVISLISQEVLMGPIDDEEQKWKIRWLLFFISGGCLKYILGYLYIFWVACKLAVDYENIQNYFQVIQYTLNCMGVALVFCPTVYWWYWSAFSIQEELNPIIIKAGVLLGVFILSISMLNYYSAYKEKPNQLVLSMILQIISIIFCSFYVVMIVVYTQSYLNSLYPSCYDILRMMSSTHIQKLGCPYKYLALSDSTNFNCPKGQTSLAWEEPSHYGCLNPQCCDVISQSSTAGLDYMVGFAVTAMLMLSLTFYSSRYLLRKIQKFGLTQDKRVDDKILLVIVLSFFVVMAWAFAAKFEVDIAVPRTGVSVRVKDAGALPSKYLTEEYCVKGIDIDIGSNWNLRREFLVEVSAQGAELRIPEGSEFTATAVETKRILKESRLCPHYLGVPILVSVELWETRRLQEDEENEEEEDEEELPPQPK